MRTYSSVVFVVFVTCVASCSNQESPKAAQPAAAAPQEAPQLICDEACRAKRSGTGNFPSLGVPVPPKTKPATAAVEK